MASSREKGDELERAIRAIEEIILAASPGLQENSFLVESKKIIRSGGVANEIDLYIRVEVANGYDAIFIFECKNWEKKVDKNELIIFSEKINIAAAQRGFFVAKSYTKDARAQASKDPRIQLLTFKDLPLQGVSALSPLYYKCDEGAQLRVDFTVTDKESHLPVPFLPIKDFSWKGEPVRPEFLGQMWRHEIWETHFRDRDLRCLSEGHHSIPVNGRKSFEAGQLTVQGHDILWIDYEAVFNVRIVRPRIRSYFNLETRGRALQLEPTDLGSAGPITIVVAETQELGHAGAVPILRMRQEPDGVHVTIGLPSGALPSE